jgi:hypothetical protein
MALVTKDSVFGVCDRTKAAEDREPTLEEIRKALGGGSERDISRYRDDWREASSKKAELASKPPPEVQRASDEAGRRIWAEAQRLANSVLTAAHEESEAKLSRLQKDNEEVLALLNVKDERISALTKQLESAEITCRTALDEAERHKGALRKQEEIARRQDDEIQHLRTQLRPRSPRTRKPIPERR